MCFMLQTRPTKVEEQLIVSFERALVPALHNMQTEPFDVLDELDIKEAAELGLPEPVPAGDSVNRG